MQVYQWSVILYQDECHKGKSNDKELIKDYKSNLFWDMKLWLKIEFDHKHCVDDDDDDEMVSTFWTKNTIYSFKVFFFFFLVSFGVSKSITNPFLIHVVLTEFYKNLIFKKNYTFTSKIILF
jgi:hypothetical protein